MLSPHIEAYVVLILHRSFFQPKMEVFKIIVGVLEQHHGVLYIIDLLTLQILFQTRVIESECPPNVLLVQCTILI